MNFARLEKMDPKTAAILVLQSWPQSIYQKSPWDRGGPVSDRATKPNVGGRHEWKNLKISSMRILWGGGRAPRIQTVLYALFGFVSMRPKIPTVEYLTNPDKFNARLKDLWGVAARSYKPTDKIFILGRSGCGKSFRKINSRSIRQTRCHRLTLRIFREWFWFCRRQLSVFFKCLVHLEKKNILNFISLQFINGSEEREQLFDRICECILSIGDVCLVIERSSTYYSSPQFLHWFKILR